MAPYHGSVCPILGAGTKTTVALFSKDVANPAFSHQNGCCEKGEKKPIKVPALTSVLLQNCV